METQNTPAKKVTVRARTALNPEAPELVQPWKEFISKGLGRLYVEFGPMGTTHQICPLGAARKEGEGDLTRITLGELRDRIETGNLVPRRKAKGQSSGINNQPLPLKSLCEEDFKGSDEKLLQRIRAVATAIGSDVARSRIMTHKLNAAGHDDFETWWNESDGASKAKLLVDLKHANKIGPDLIKISTLDYPCPFRGSLLPPQAAKPEKAKENETRPERSGSDSSQQPNGIAATGSSGKKTAVVAKPKK